MSDLLYLIALFLFVWFLWSAIRCKEIAIRAGKTYCEKQGLQFLDHTVERQKLYLTRDPRNNPCWFRSYQFEFATSGEFRYQGRIEMYGQKLKSIEVDPFPDSNVHSLH